MGEITGCNSYRICDRCGNICYFMDRKPEEPNLLQRNIEADPNRTVLDKTESLTLTCKKCGNIINLC